MNKTRNLISANKEICIVGTGGFAREVFCYVVDYIESINNPELISKVCFLEQDELWEKNWKGKQIMGAEVIKESSFDPKKYVALIGVGDSKLRKRIVEKMPKDTVYPTLVHPTAVISRWVEIGEGAIITPGVVITSQITIGKHAHLNLYTTIGHDCVIGDYFTTAPSANISGICNFGDCVYFGTNSAVRQGVNICDNVTIGMGAVVVKDIMEEGVYIGNPLRKLEK